MSSLRPFARPRRLQASTFANVWSITLWLVILNLPRGSVTATNRTQASAAARLHRLGPFRERSRGSVCRTFSLNAPLPLSTLPFSWPLVCIPAWSRSCVDCADLVLTSLVNTLSRPTRALVVKFERQLSEPPVSSSFNSQTVSVAGDVRLLAHMRFVSHVVQLVV